MKNSQYTVEGSFLPGFAKMGEECNELSQVILKVIGNNGSFIYWDDRDLREHLIEEIGDTLNAIKFFMEENLTLDEILKVEQRTDTKNAKFHLWRDKTQNG